MKSSPAKISSITSNQVFVFGSNLLGLHAGGAAQLALKFGAVNGCGVGSKGNTYAIPTMYGPGIPLEPGIIMHYVNRFIETAIQHPELEFLVTRIGCGIAGYTDEEIAPLFKGAIGYENILLPQEFINVLSYVPK